MFWDSDGCAAMASAQRESLAGAAAGGVKAARRAVDWLALAAAPAFALMALLTGVLDGGASNMCMDAPHAFLLAGMGPMYLLMSIFHVGPWLKLIAGWRQGA